MSAKNIHTLLWKTTSDELRRLINSHKLLRHNLKKSHLTVEAEEARVVLYTEQYLDGLKLVEDLSSTEVHIADDLALLAGNVLVNLWKLTSNDRHLFSAVALFEFALTKSKPSFQMRLILIRIYRLLGMSHSSGYLVPFINYGITVLGAPSLALEHYRILQIKQVQHDTLSHYLLSRASTFSLAATGDLTFATECVESTQVYLTNSQEVCNFFECFVLELLKLSSDE